nr:type IX secretion system sortase PorU [Bernardetiaceae bacterium]
LASGQWYKVAVPQTGLYKIDRGFWQRLGVDAAQLDPRQVRVFGQPGGMLPQPNAAPRPTDLVELAVQLDGQDDGRWDADDALLFYAQGPDLVALNPATGLFGHEKHLYDNFNYYFLQVNAGQPGKRLARQADAGSGTPITTFDDYFYHEKDDFNIVRSGRFWYGERFDLQADYTIRFPVPGLVAGSVVRVRSVVMAQANAATTFNLQLNGRELGSQTLALLPLGTYARKGLVADNTFGLTLEATPANNELAVRLAYDKRGATSAFGHLDALGLNLQRQLRLYGAQTSFRAVASRSMATAEFRLAAAPPDLQVWDVTDLFNARQQTLRRQGETAAFGVSPGGQLREFVAWRSSELPAPEPRGRVANQNLRQLAPPELLIITHPTLTEPAQRLANHRRTRSGLATEVVTTEQVYHEFAGGKQDVTALRDLLRHLRRASDRLRYVLLFGDASYDYKDRQAGNRNLVPTYESRESLHPIFSFSSDDFFGFLAANEGEWDENGGDNYQMQVGIGRLPVATVAEANTVIDKLIRYEQASSQGQWRTQLCFVADNGDFNIHQLDAEQLATKADTTGKIYNIDKIYVDAFPLVATPNGGRAPEARAALDGQVGRTGALIVNFTGHGGESGWTSEAILDIAMLGNWANRDRLPLFVTATCEFGRFDDPNLTSGAELAVLSPRGGGIAMVTTTRPVFSSTNFLVNNAFYDVVFAPINGQMPRLGDVQRLTKNRSASGVVNRNFSLLGDPSLRLAYPSLAAQITSVRAQGQPADTLRALAQVQLSGQIQQNGRLLADFNGPATVTVYDKPNRLRTRGQEDEPMDYTDLATPLFRGQATVRNGLFELSFTVPKDIDYRFGPGRVFVYARDSTRNLDAGGSHRVLVGGTAPNFPADNQPPQIRLFMDSEQFEDGGTTGTDPTLLVHLADDQGINITGAGLGHELLATLDGQQTFVLNPYYLAQPDNPGQGRASLPLVGLAEGPHVLTVKAWDVHNNPAEAQLRFTVAKEPFGLGQVLAWPNPFRERVNLRFAPNRPGEDLRILLEVYTSTGALVHRHETVDYNVQTAVETLTWDGRQPDGRLASPGLYLYRLTVTPLRGQETPAVVSGRLVLAP